MNDSLFDLVPAVMLGWVGAIWTFGELKTVDIVGSLISPPIFAYKVHLSVA